MQSRIINQYSPYVYWYFGDPYQMHRYERLFDRIGGRTYTPGQKIKGILLCANLVKHVKKKEVIRVLCMHGTSNKHEQQHYGPMGRNNYDYYWVSGPKHKWQWKNIGHKALWRKEVKIGNIVSDLWFDGNQSKKQICKQVGIDNQKPILLFAPSFGAEALNHAFLKIEPLKEQYHIIVKPHPYDKIKDEEKKKYPWAHVTEGNVYRLLYLSDVLMTDTSSIMYDFAITGRPIILMDLHKDAWIWDPPKFNMRYHAARWDFYSDKDIFGKLQEAQFKRRETKKVFYDSFYYNDGHSVDRAYDWIIKMIDKRFL